MIKLIGRKRFFLLLVLGMINIVLAAFLFLWVQPSSAEAQMRLNGLNSQIGTLQTDIATIKKQIETTRENIPYFNRLGTIGFFSNQDRFEAERVIQTIQKESGIKAASFKIGAQKDVKDDTAEEAKYRLVVSPIKIDMIKSYNDVEVYKLAYLMNNSFTGHTRLVSFELARPLVITETDIEGINEPNKDVFFVRGSMDFEWYTMLEDEPESVPPVGGGN